MKPALKRIVVGSLLLMACLSAAHAQYKYVAADGSITYSDRPPPPDAKQVAKTGAPGSATTAAEELPFAIRAAQQRHPVVLYSATDCGPCTSVKLHLQKRGIPFTEKLIRNDADLAAMKPLGFSDSNFPAISVGIQKQTGFEPTALDGLLDLAGYPKNGKLPAGYVAQSAPLTADAVKPIASEVANVPSANTRPKREPKPIEAAPKPEPKPLIRF